MSDSASQRVNCPGCSKGYRWDPGLVGQTVACRKCGVTFSVPDHPGGVGTVLDAPPATDGTYELDLEAGIEHPDEPAPLAAPPNEGKCPSCNSKISESAVICLNCGLNLREGTMLKPTVSELTVADRKEGQIPLRNMKLVRLGMWLHLLAALMTAGAIAAEIFAFFAVGWAYALMTIVAITGIVSSAAGSLLCLAAPKESGGRPVLLISIIFSGTSLIADILIESGVLSSDLGLVSGLLNIVGTICFLAFFVILAKFLEFPEITERAEKVFGLYLLLLVASVLTILPFISCFIALLVVGTAVYAAALYIMLLVDLNNALNYRIAEEAE